jgi:hypothetical protein
MRSRSALGQLVELLLRRLQLLLDARARFTHGETAHVRIEVVGSLHQR